jgi:hypothetical protein
MLHIILVVDRVSVARSANRFLQTSVSAPNGVGIAWQSLSNLTILAVAKVVQRISNQRHVATIQAVGTSSIRGS